MHIMSQRIWIAGWLLGLMLVLPLPGYAQQQTPQPAACTVIEYWPEVPRNVANEMITKYGQPDGVTPSRLIWENRGPWREIIVYRNEVQHNFPTPHTDVLEQVINYQVPAELFDELAAYDGSVIVERTRGTMAARCDKEAANFLALNLAHDIVTGEKTVEEARAAYAQAVAALQRGERPLYTQGLQFRPPVARAAGDPDVAVI
jgi:hypothetical protein